MNTPASTPPRSRLVRASHGTVCVVLALSLAFFALLGVMTLSPAVYEGVFNLLDSTWGESDSHRMLGLGALVGAWLFAGGLVWFGRKASGRVLAGAAAVVIAVFTYLAWDVTPARRLNVEEFFPKYPGADASYAVLMRYGKNHPAGRDFKGSNLSWASSEPEKWEAWVEFVTTHRTRIEAEWVALAPVRDWWAELNAFEHVVDLMPPHMGGELLAFRPVRELTQRACAIATLRTLDGRGDEAIATLLPLIEVSRKLQLTGRSLVIQMVSLTAERMAMQTVGLVLDRAHVSPAMRARLAAVLAQPGGGEAGARRLVIGEAIAIRNTILDGESWEGEPNKSEVLARLLDPVLYNPHATVNLYAPFAAELEEYVGRRELAKIEPATVRFLEHQARPAFKNMGGRRLLQMVVFAYGKVATAYWKAQDLRAALLARLQAEAAK